MDKEIKSLSLFIRIITSVIEPYLMGYGRFSKLTTEVTPNTINIILNPSDDKNLPQVDELESTLKEYLHSCDIKNYSMIYTDKLTLSINI